MATRMKLSSGGALAMTIWVVCSGCAVAVRNPRPKDAEPRSETSPVAGEDAGRLKLTKTALALRGAPYRNGGSDRSGFDCSGFTQFVFAQHGVYLPREVRAQFAAGYSVDRGHLRPGDLIFFTTTEPGASHVAIAIGGDEFVHAPSTRGVVRVERLDAGYWSQRFIGARRVIAD